MKGEDVLEALKKMRSLSKKRRFVQSIELMINFSNLDYKKQENQIEVRVKLPHATKKAGGRALLFAKTEEFANKVRDRVSRIILDTEIPKLTKKDVGEIINDFDLLLAEGATMLTVGKHLGQQLAPRGRMPKLIQSSTASIDEALKELGGAMRVTNKKGKPMPVVQVLIGDESMSNEQLAENAMTVIAEVTNALPNKQQNIRTVLVKETMGPAIRVGGK